MNPSELIQKQERIRERISHLRNKVYSKEISRLEFDSILECGFDGKSAKYWLDLYDLQIEKYNRNIQRNSRIISAVILVILLMPFVFYSNLLGFVTFGITSSKIISPNITLNSNETYVMNLDSEYKTLLVSAQFLGPGDSALYLLENGSRHLLLYKDKAMGNNVKFVSDCINCNFKLKGNAIIWLNSSSKVIINKIEALSTELIEFTIEPKTIRLPLNEKSKTSIRINNKENSNITLIAYVSGDLSKEITLEKSLINIKSNESHYDFQISSNIKQRGSAQIIFRYVASNKFAGETPFEVVELIADSLNIEKPKNFDYKWMIFLLLLMPAILFAIFKLKQRKV